MRVTELRAAQGPRSIAEARYLDGHPALVPDAVRTWDEQLGSTERLADLASRLAELDGVGPAEPMDPDAVSARTAVLLADLVEPARATALEKLGVGERAIRIATGWLRAKMTAQATATNGAGPVPQIPSP